VQWRCLRPRRSGAGGRIVQRHADDERARHAADQPGRHRGHRGDRRAGRGTETYRAGVVVVSCGAANSARLLLASANDKHSRGLAGGSGQVGRNYMFHNSSAVLALSKEPNPTKYQKTLSLNDMRNEWGNPSHQRIALPTANANPAAEVNTPARADSTSSCASRAAVCAERASSNGPTPER
jgi:choline dehydrogenase-like flavoprotein